MESSQEMDVFAQVYKVRKADLQGKGEGLRKLLDEACRFLQEHQTVLADKCTHKLAMNFMDWWCTMPKFSLALDEDSPEDMEMFFKYIGALFDAGIPLTLAERPSPKMRLFLDVVIIGTEAQSLPTRQLVAAHSPFLHLIGHTVASAFPSMKSLEVAIFDASGMSPSQGVQETVLRLVWPELVVNADRQQSVRSHIVWQFTHSSKPEIQELGATIRGVCDRNGWESVFPNTLFREAVGIRMPLCDQVTPPPLKMPERRPLAPCKMLRLDHPEGELEAVAAVQCEGNLQWLMAGVTRRRPTEPLTEPWVPPPQARDGVVVHRQGGRRFVTRYGSDGPPAPRRVDGKGGGKGRGKGNGKADGKGQGPHAGKGQGTLDGKGHGKFDGGQGQYGTFDGKGHGKFDGKGPRVFGAKGEGRVVEKGMWRE